VDHRRTAGLQRAAIVFGHSILALFAALALLKIAGGKWTDPLVRTIVVGLIAAIGVAAAYVLFQWVRMRAFYRCPRCGARPISVPKALPAIHYFCSACDVQWDTGLEERDYES
jgi:hypothetical protein